MRIRTVAVLTLIGLTACGGGTSTKVTECNNANTYLKTVSAQNAELNTVTANSPAGPGRRETSVAVAHMLQSFLSIDSTSVPTYAVPFSKANNKFINDYGTLAAAYGAGISSGITPADIQNDQNAWATEVANLRTICAP